MLRRVGSLIALAVFGIALAACSSLRTDFVERPSKALAPTTTTPSARYIRSEVDQHLDKSGFRLLTRSTNALMSRIALADHAKHSIDLQYYIFKNDATGRLVAQHLLTAADRGVRVRILLDDISLNDEIDMLDALDAHPNIEVRLFNPFHTRDPSFVSKATQFLFNAHRLNRRMHNKSFIVDGDVAIVGGRNSGDDYFDAGNDTNFRDLDLIAIGPVVREASHTFDEYWNCDAAFPVTAFRGKHAVHDDLARLRADLGRDARDQRSKLLNTEMGVIVDCPQLADAVKQFFDTATLPANAYHVVLTAPGGSLPAGKMQWQASDGGKPATYDGDPDVTSKRRGEVEALKLLPIEGIL